MKYEIKKYPVLLPILKNYIKFFWELHIDNMQLNHNIIPQRNINLRFNLSETPQYISIRGGEYLLDNVFFSGLQDHYCDTTMKLSGKIDMLGVCFLPESFYPLLKIPVSEFKNQILGASETGFRLLNTICERLKEAPNVLARLNILENELAKLLYNGKQTPDNFRKLFEAVNQNNSSVQLTEFCKQHNIGLRSLERLYNKYVGTSAITYCTLNRFQNSLNQVLCKDYCKLSDIAYGNGYFDQMHFIKEFKRFTGNTPKNFVFNNNSILQIGKLT